MVYSAPSARTNSTRKSLHFSLFAAIVLAPALVGCGRNEDPAPSNGTNPPAVNADKGGGTTANKIDSSDFKVALVMPGQKSDHGWNAGAAQAMEAVKTELQLPDDNVRSVDNQKTPGDQEKSLRDFGAKKFNIVFANGS